MADKAISELVAASQVKANDLFVLEQDNAAKKLTGQILENWLVSFADGHGGIQSIAYLSTDVLEDTYVITLADTTTFEFTVTNGKSITGITKSGSSGLTDTYKISYNDGTSTTFPVTNGRGIKSWTESISGLAHTYAITYDDNTTTFLQIKDGAKGDKGDNAYLWIKYASQKPTASSHSMSDVPDDWIGVYSGNSATAPTDYTQYDWFQYKGDKGDKGDPALLQSQAVAYQVSDSGTIIPSGSWSSSIPVVAQGKYLWTRTTVNFNSGNPVVSYSVSRMGLDGTGSVSSVAGVSPDSDGNVPLTPANIGALPTTGGAMTGPLNMNGQPISGMNPPTASTQAANKGYVDASSSKAVPYNLLDNSDFRNPVNQRGASSYTLGAWGGYTIDRWAAYESGCAVTASDDGIQLNGALYQPISKETARRYNGKTVTIAAKIGGNVYSAHGVVNQAGSYNVTASVDTPYGKLLLTCENANTLFFTIRNNTSAVVEWAALYEGEYTAETLPEYHPKGYAVELAECQRYFQRIEFSWQILAVASPRTAATTRSGMILPQMPRISIPTCTYAGSNAVLASTEGNKIITELKPVARGNIMRIECTAESVTAGMPYAIYGNSSSEYIDISADL